MENPSPKRRFLLIGQVIVVEGSEIPFLTAPLIHAQQILADTLTITIEECREFTAAVEQAFPLTASFDELRQLAKPTQEQLRIGCWLARLETPKHPPHYRKRNRDKRPVLGKADYTVKRR